MRCLIGESVFDVPSCKGGVMPALDAGIHAMVQRQRSYDLYQLRSLMDRRGIGERSDAVLRTAKPGDDTVLVDAASRNGYRKKLNVLAAVDVNLRAVHIGRHLG